jgi:hypothetical protein
MSEDLPQARTIAGDRADILYRAQGEIKDTLARIIKAQHEPGRFDDNHWHHRAAEEVFGYIDRVLRHQSKDGGRPGNNGRK